MNQNRTDKSIHQIFLSKIKFRIYTLFEIYRKLTLQEIADKLSRDKSSIHPHVRKLIEIGILKPPKEVDEKRNYILELTDDYEEKLNQIDGELEFENGLTPTLISQVTQMGSKWMQVEKSLLDEHIQFNKIVNELNQKPEYSQEVYDLYQSIFAFDLDSNGNVKLNENGLPSNTSQSSNAIYYFDEETYTDFRAEWLQLTNKYGKIMAKKNESLPSLRRSVCFLAHSMPIEKIVEYNNRKDILTRFQ